MNTFSLINLVSTEEKYMGLYLGRVKAINSLIGQANARITNGNEMGAALDTERDMGAAYGRLESLNILSKQLNPDGLYSDQLETINEQMKEAYGIFHCA